MTVKIPMRFFSNGRFASETQGLVGGTIEQLWPTTATERTVGLLFQLVAVFVVVVGDSIYLELSS